MQTVMVPDAHHLLSTALPLGPPADHAKTLESVWRPGPAAFCDPARERAAAAGLWDVPGQTSLCGATLLDISGCPAAATRADQPAWGQRRAEPCAAPGQTNMYPARSESCAAGFSARTALSTRPAPQLTALYPSAGDVSSCGSLAGPETRRPYPGRAVPVPAPAPLRSSHVSSSTDARVTKDFSQPLFVDTTVEYDLPKAAYPPENSEPLLIVHPQYFEHLRHRRTLGAGCACQLCNFYGRRLPAPGGATSAPAGPAATASASAAVPQTFQRPGAPRDWQAFQPPQQQLQQQQRQQQQPQHLLQPQQPQLRLQQQRQQQLLSQQPLQPQQQSRQAQQTQQLLQQQRQQQAQQQQQRYNCMFGGVGERRLSLAPPSVSCDSDSGYSSVELEPAESCRRPADQARDVLAKRKRRHEPAPAPLQTAGKRPRLSFWQSGAVASELTSYPQHRPGVI